MAVDVLYTGKNLTPELQSDGGKAMSRLSDFITRAEEIKYKAFKENEDWFLKTQEVDPAFLVSTQNQKVATELMDKYNKESAAIYRQYNGNPPTEAKQEILAKKNFLIANQNKMIAKERLAEQHRAQVAQNPLRYDKNKFEKEYGNFIKTGDYNLITPPLKSKKPTSFLKEQSFKLNKDNLIYGQPRTDSMGKIINTSSNIREEDIPNFIVDMIRGGDDQFVQGVVEDFLADQSDAKWALMKDVNEDGRITNEDMDDNAIEAWAKQNPEYINSVRITKDSKPINPPTKKDTKSGVEINIGGKDVRVQPAEKRPKGLNYGGSLRNNLYSFGGATVVTDIPTDGGNMLLDNRLSALRGGSNISGQLVDYDADKKVIIIRTTTGIPTLRIDPKQLVEVPIDNIPNANNLPIMVDGKQTTIGELNGTQKPTIN